MIATIWKQPLAPLLALPISATALLPGVFNHAVYSGKGSSANSSRAQPKSPKDTIVLAKRLVGLSENAAAGLLWRTYMTRVNRVAFNSTVEQMEMGQVNCARRAWLISDGLPDWFPFWTIPFKENFETNFLRRVVEKRLYSLSPFCSDEELTRVEMEKQREYERQATRANTELDFYAWKSKLIVQGLGLPSTTSYKEARNAYNRMTHIGGPVTAEENAAVGRRLERENALRVLENTNGMSNLDLLTNLMTVRKAVRLESPDKPTSFDFFF